jgi:hypothetical protein
MTVAEGFSTASVPDDAANLRRIVWSSVIGTAVEWYDFLIYGAATALVFNKVFFAAGDPALATIAAFGTPMPSASWPGRWVPRSSAISATRSAARRCSPLRSSSWGSALS